MFYCLAKQVLIPAYAGDSPVCSIVLLNSVNTAYAGDSPVCSIVLLNSVNTTYAGDSPVCSIH